MITVVIPTMLLCPKDIFLYTLDQLNSNKIVKEIIIIDNTPEKLFEQFFHSPKLNILKPTENAGASYNLGMDICKTKYYLLINDDVASRSSIIDSCFDIMEKDGDIGLMQVDTVVREPLDLYITSDNNKELQYIFPENSRACMTGWFQFGRTVDWIPIPKELKYFFGDDLMLEIMKHEKRKVCRLVSDHISHAESSTVSKVVGNRVMYDEQTIYQNILKRVFNEKNSTK